MNDDGRGQCLATFLMDPTSGGLPRDASAHQPGETGEDDDRPPARAPRLREAGSSGADPESASQRTACICKQHP
eukprot:7043189-Pyramimonas_sp.AAC.1